MIERLDKGCKAKILAVTDSVLMLAQWRATKSDLRNFFITKDGMTQNILCVSKEYFKRRYGVDPCNTL